MLLKWVIHSFTTKAEFYMKQLRNKNSVLYIIVGESDHVLKENPFVGASITVKFQRFTSMTTFSSDFPVQSMGRVNACKILRRKLQVQTYANNVPFGALHKYILFLTVRYFHSKFQK